MYNFDLVFFIFVQQETNVPRSFGPKVQPHANVSPIIHCQIIQKYPGIIKLEIVKSLDICINFLFIKLKLKFLNILSIFCLFRRNSWEIQFSFFSNKKHNLQILDVFLYLKYQKLSSLHHHLMSNKYNIILHILSTFQQKVY